jgi:hypothetical protein
MEKDATSVGPMQDAMDRSEGIEARSCKTLMAKIGVLFEGPSYQALMHARLCLPRIL